MNLEGRYYEFSFSMPRAYRLALYNKIEKNKSNPPLIQCFFGDEILTVVVPDTSALFGGVTPEILVRSWFDVANVKWVNPYQTVIIDGPAMEAHLKRVGAVSDTVPTYHTVVLGAA